MLAPTTRSTCGCCGSGRSRPVAFLVFLAAATVAELVSSSLAHPAVLSSGPPLRARGSRDPSADSRRESIIDVLDWRSSMAHLAADLAVTLPEDRPGMLSKALNAVSSAGLNLEGHAEMEGVVHVLTTDPCGERAMPSKAGFPRRSRAAGGARPGRGSPGFGGGHFSPYCRCQSQHPIQLSGDGQPSRDRRRQHAGAHRRARAGSRAPNDPRRGFSCSRSSRRTALPTI